MLQEIENVKVVLVHPRDSRNIGAVCRAMKNMGMRRLTVVREAPIDYEQARVLAIHASDVLEEARVCRNLHSALAGCALAAGITRRRGRYRKYFSILPEQLAQRVAAIRKGETALVFGNEEAGLSDRELACCNLAVRIPSSSLFPSLNLSHAVQIVCYQLFRDLSAGGFTPYAPIRRDSLDALVSVMLASLGDLGFFKQVTPEDMGVFLRDILARAGLSVREAKRLETVARKIGGLAAGRGRKANSP